MTVLIDSAGLLSVVVKVRISEPQLMAWQAAARSDHRVLSDWIRMRCDGLPASPPPDQAQVPARPYTAARLRAKAKPIVKRARSSK